MAEQKNELTEETENSGGIKTQKDPEIEKLKDNLRQYPTRPYIGVGAVIIYDRKIVFIKRKYEPDANLWAIPGGHLELGETCAHCAERETKEETGIDVVATTLAGVIDKIMYDEEGAIQYHYVLVNYNVEIVDERFSDGIPQLKATSDALDIKFVPFEEIENYNISNSVRQLLQDLGILAK